LWIGRKPALRRGHDVVLTRCQHQKRSVRTGRRPVRDERIPQIAAKSSCRSHQWSRAGRRRQSSAETGGFDPKRVLKTAREDGLNYRLYRTTGDYKASYDLHGYPFDVQQLRVRFQDAEQRRELVTYVIDAFSLRLRGERSTVVEDSAYSGLQLWRFLPLRYFVDSFSTGSTLGRPSLPDVDARAEFAGFNAAVVLQRDFITLIVKTLMPLFLLVMVVFATLFFPETLMRERITLPITAILTSAVLLVAVNNQLGDIRYTVAIAPRMIWVPIAPLRWRLNAARTWLRRTGDTGQCRLKNHLIGAPLTSLCTWLA
jgi:hypothetical protein